jgi:hypothetical protein
MIRPFLAILVAALVAAPGAVAIDGKQAQALLRLAVKATGLTAKQPVRIVAEPRARFKQRRVTLFDRGYPRAAQAHDEKVYRALGLLTGGTGTLRNALLALDTGPGVYDPFARTAYVRAGKGERAAALRQLVHALQDQHFDLKRVRRLAGSRDAAVAATAAIEGHASLLLGAPPAPKPGAGSRLTRFLVLERGFESTVGLRLATDLHNLGGTPAVRSALRRFPATTEQVFHLDKFLQRERAVPIVLPDAVEDLQLGSTGTFGELDVRALLAVFGVPGLDAAATGWGGGRSAVYRDAATATAAVLVALDWDSEVNAGQWATTATTYVEAAFGEGTLTDCAASACWILSGRTVAFDRLGVHTALVVSANVKHAGELARAATLAG